MSAARTISAVAFGLLLSAAVPAAAQERLATRSTATPRTATLGEVVTYSGQVTGGPTGRYRWIAPDPRTDLTWGAPSTTLRRRIAGNSGDQRPPLEGPHGTFERSAGVEDTMVVELPVQIFAFGKVSLPGMRLEITQPSGRRVVSLPSVEVTVVPTLDPADTSATLEPLRTFAAPWWERVPWSWVVAALALIALAIWIWRRLRRRRPAEVAAPAQAPRRSATAEALEALAQLRAMGLPEQGRFAEHAFRLGQILRRYLEATVITARPGDTTPELIAHLREARLEPADLQRLSGLLRVWDRVKFAREAFTAAEAERTESAVESFVRQPAGTSAAKVA